jgi:hypothetical protein
MKLTMCDAVLFGALLPAAALAQVPANIQAGLKKIGPIVDPQCTAKLYRPLMPANDINSTVVPLYPGITIARDISVGPNPKDVVDIFTADKGSTNRPVLIYVPGGAGNKIEQQDREGNAFYDNIARWATKNGMVGVLVQRHPGQAWDDPAKDISTMIQWLQAHVAEYKGNPDRMFIWAHSAGNGPVGTYLGRPELYGPKGVGVKGAVLMSGQFNILPVQPQGARGRGAAPAAGRGAAAAPAGNPLAGAGSTCGNPEPGLIAGPSRGAAPAPRAGGPGAAPAAAGRGGRGAAVDPATQLARSTLPALKKTDVKLMLVTAEFDPGINGTHSAFNQALHDELCKEGPAHCPTLLFAKQESHMSEVFSIDTSDKNVSGPILAWMKKIK